MSAKEFLYDSKLKSQRIGRYSSYEGFQCKICNRIVKDIKKHVAVVHPESIALQLQHLAVPDSTQNSIEGFISGYERILMTSGVGKLEKVLEKIATSYGNQNSRESSGGHVFS